MNTKHPLLTNYLLRRDLLDRPNRPALHADKTQVHDAEKKSLRRVGVDVHPVERRGTRAQKLVSAQSPDLLIFEVLGLSFHQIGTAICVIFLGVA